MEKDKSPAAPLPSSPASLRWAILRCGLLSSPPPSGAGCWPSEDVLGYFCLNHSNVFRSKRVPEPGSGYGLAGLAIAASTDACEVVISDGNPQVVDYIKHIIYVNAGVFGNTKENSMTLHRNQDPVTDILNIFDIIVASD